MTRFVAYQRDTQKIPIKPQKSQLGKYIKDESKVVCLRLYVQ